MPRPGGREVVGALAARNFAWSLSVHSHSRLFRNSNGDGNWSLLRVLSTWNTRTVSAAAGASGREWCIAEFGGSLNERESRSVWTLWWCRRLLYDASPTATDLAPPFIATRLMFT